MESTQGTVLSPKKKKKSHGGWDEVGQTPGKCRVQRKQVKRDRPTRSNTAAEPGKESTEPSPACLT